MIELFSSLTILVLSLLVYFQRRTIVELENEVWFLERTYTKTTGNPPPRMGTKMNDSQIIEIGSSNFFEYKNHVLEVLQNKDQKIGDWFCYYLKLSEFNSIFTKDSSIREVKEKCDEFGEWYGGVSYCRLFTEKISDHPIKSLGWKNDFYYFKIGCAFHGIDDLENGWSFDDVLKHGINTIDKLLESKILKELQ